MSTLPGNACTCPVNGWCAVHNATGAGTVPAPIVVFCETCGKLHTAEYSHDGQWGQGPIFAAECPTDYLTDYYTAEAATR